VRFDVKSIIKKLKLDIEPEVVEQALEKLTEQGRLKTTRSGKVKWNKNQNTRNKAARRSAKEMAVGVMDVTRSGAAYVMVDGFEHEKDIFVPSHRQQSALHGDTVEVAWSLSKRGKPEGDVVRVIQRKNNQFVGKLVISRKYAFVTPDNENIPFDIEIDKAKLPDGAVSGDKVVVAVQEWHTKNTESPKGEISVVFGQEDSNDIEMQTILVNKGFNLAFPADVLHENATIDIDIKEEEIAKRRDMRKITTFTIDPETAKDFDDALSIQKLDNGNYEIGVHIADVTHYVQPDTALDKEAARRTTSVYLVDRVLPMLPEKLSNGACSLRPHEEKYTFSAVFELDRKGDIVHEWFGKTAIYSDRRFTYEEAQQGLETGEGDFAEELKVLNHYAILLRKKRFKKGSINFESPEVKFKLDENGKPVDVYLKVRKDANMLIEDFMLLANKRVGALLAGQLKETNKEWPMVYRIHDEPNMEKVAAFTNFAASMGYPMEINSPEQVQKAFGKMLKEAEGKPEYEVLQQMGIRTMAKAVYSADNIGHYGLGFETYSHFTSPIRRYADVLGHRVLFDFLNNGKRMNKSKLEELCKHISKKERDAMEAERESVKYKQAEFLEEHLNEVFSGIITGIAEHGIYVRLSANFCEGMIRYDKMYDNFSMDESRFSIRSSNKKYRMGDKVWIKVLGADKKKRQMDFELLDPTELDELDKQEKKTSAAKAIEVQKEATEQKNTNASTVEPTEVVEKTKVKKETPKVNMRTFNSLLKKVAALHDDSDIKKEATKRERQWGYEISTAALTENSVLYLHFHPKVQPKKDYTNQESLSTRPLRLKKGNTQQFFKTYFADENLVDGYVIPLHSLDETQFSDRDKELSIPLFKSFLSLVKPTQIVCFSNHAQQLLSDAGLLSKVQHKTLIAGKRSILVTKGTIRVGRSSRPICFLPNPTSRISKTLKEQAWNWGLNR
jgi:ribonuclease R